VRSNYLFTSESVSEGHPDKVCDRISDAVVDAYLTADPVSRVAVETMTTTNRIVISGEVRGPDSITSETIETLARDAVRDIGYEQAGFHWNTAEVGVHVHKQSVDIAQGVDSGEDKDEGAGDQGIMFGYACRETEVLMPAPIYYSHRILQDLARARHSGDEPGLGPDAKSQVSLRYENGSPTGASSIVVSTQHDEDLSQADVRKIVRPYVIAALPKGWMCPEEEFYVNPTGRFVIGGPDGDARTGVARFRARIRARLTARPPMPRATWRRMSLPRAWRSAAPFSLLMPSAWPNRCRSTSICRAPERSRRAHSKTR